MTINTMRTLVLSVTLITIVASERCKVPVPFNSKLVGSRFFENVFFGGTTLEGSSIRARSKTSFTSRLGFGFGITGIRVHAKLIVFYPFFPLSPSLPVCVEKYALHFRSHRKDPVVLYLPEVDIPRNSFKQATKFCKKQQRELREKYFPIGGTRKKFKKAIREITKTATRIRDFNNRGRRRPIKKVGLDGIVTYLLGVAYQYNFCAESS